MKIRSIAILVFGMCILNMTLLALPDAKITTQITYTPSSISEGNSVTFSASFQILNETVSNFKIEGGIDGAVIYTRTFASVAAGATRSMSFTWTATAGTHTAFFRLDPSNGISESDETNNYKEISFTAAGAANPSDLAFNVGPQITPGDQLFTGTSLNIKAQIYNSYFPVTSVKLRATIDGAQVWQTTLAQMAANEYYWVDFNWTATVGNHTLLIAIDPDNQITETNETNNEWSYPFTILDPQQPPVNNPDIKFNGNITFSPFTPQEGDPQEVKVRLYNASSVTATNVNVVGGIDSVQQFEEIIPSFSGYAYKDVKFTWTTAVAGSHTAYFTIDPDNSIVESNESNNNLTATTNVAAKPTGPTPGLSCDPQWDLSIGIQTNFLGTIKPQDTVKLWARLKLTGNTAVNLKVTMGVDNKKLDEKVFAQFSSAQASDIYLIWKALASGTHKIWFQVDPDSEQNDTDRSNNRLEKDVTIEQLHSINSPEGIQSKLNPDPCERATSPNPDLRIVSFEQKPPYSNDKVFFKVVVKNESDRCVKGTGFAVYHDGISTGEPVFKFWMTPEGNISTSPYMTSSASNKWFMKANESKTIESYIAVSEIPNPTDCVITAAGNVPGYCRKLKIKADFEDKITETNESNNASPFKIFSWKK